MRMEISLRLDDAEFLAGVVVARDVKLVTTPAGLAQQLNTLVAERSSQDYPPPPVKEAIRHMLRRGGFRPAGRNKPASEYLAQAAHEGRFPRINNLVDINNLLSLESGLPISLLDLAAVGSSAEIRYGREGEKYVFNAAGQEIELAGLVCVCGWPGGEGSPSIPLGNPVKDSMAGKIKDHTIGVIGVVYGSTAVLDAAAMARLLAEFTQLLKQYAGANEIESRVLSGK